MHPVIIQTTAAHRIREMQAHAAAARRARQLRHVPGRTPLPPVLVVVADRWPLAAGAPRRGLRTA